MAMITDNRVELKVPVQESYASVVRLLVSGLGARIGLPLSELDDLKLLVGEAFLTICERAEQTTGLIHLAWQQSVDGISISISDPSGRHKSVLNAANLALLKTKGADVNSTVIDGVEHLDLGFKIRYNEENRPFIFDDRNPGRA